MIDGNNIMVIIENDNNHTYNNNYNSGNHNDKLIIVKCLSNNKPSLIAILKFN